MAATERVVVLMTPEQKSDVTQRAAAEKLSLGDYMRRQALGDDELLSVLVEELTASTQKARIALDRTLARLDESERRMPEIEAAARERAKAEFTALDPELFAQLLRREFAA
ncbi:MAG TPA: hypothetical protein VMV33_01740 [Rhodocyclaceae bacterium]|nr:hypothetical protein [Rhodocyclaceae bacterium]